MKERTQVSIVDIKRMMTKEGFTRTDIRKHYELSHSDIKALFAIDELKDVRSVKPPGFTIKEHEDANTKNIVPVLGSSVEREDGTYIEQFSATEPETMQDDGSVTDSEGTNWD